VEAACVDLRKPYRLSIEQWPPNRRILYDRFHILQQAQGLSMKCRGPSFSANGGG
jgi:hypothetical protein